MLHTNTRMDLSEPGARTYSAGFLMGFNRRAPARSAVLAKIEANLNQASTLETATRLSFSLATVDFGENDFRKSIVAGTMPSKLTLGVRRSAAAGTLRAHAAESVPILSYLRAVSLSSRAIIASSRLCRSFLASGIDLFGSYGD
jgi:hypothetical protein